MIKEFWAEQKEERKQRKLLKKQNKKHRTKVEKTRYASGVIVTILIIVGAFFSTCSGDGSTGGINWGETVGITEEYIIEMEKPVDENLLFPNGKIMADDWASFVEVMKSGGMNIFDAEGKVDDALIKTEKLTSSVVVTGRHLGAISKEMHAAFGVAEIINICDFEIYQENGKFYEKSIIYLDLEKMITDIDLPAVYLTTVSEVKVLAGQLHSMNYKIVINQLSQELSDEILETINEITNDKLVRLANSTINNYIYLFFDSLNIDYVLCENGLVLSAGSIN